MSGTAPQTNVGKLFKDELDKHGYSFQDAIAKAVTEIQSLSFWSPWVPELPVETQGDHTRIDFVLTNRRGSAYLVCECKRSNPALSNWCFAETWFKPNNSLFHKAYAESLRDIGAGVLRSMVEELAPSDRLYQIAVEVKTAEKGDDNRKGRGQIEEAATQVCRQLNGLLNFFYGHTSLMAGRKKAAFVPIILTTAKLWTTEHDLSTASLDSGELDIAELPVREVPWLWYQYHQSPGLKHGVPSGHTSANIGDILFHEFVRPIAIVTPKGLSDFLRSNMWNIL